MTLAVRPEDFYIDESAAVRGRLVERLFLGQEGVAYLLEVGGLRIRCPAPANGQGPLRVGQEVGLRIIRPPVALED